LFIPIKCSLENGEVTLQLIGRMPEAHDSTIATCSSQFRPKGNLMA